MGSKNDETGSIKAISLKSSERGRVPIADKTSN